MPNAMKLLNKLLANKRKLDEASHVELNAEMSLNEVHERFSSNSRGPIHEDRRLLIEELDQWWTHKLRTPNKPNLRRNELNNFPNQLMVGDRVLLDVANLHIVATSPNEEIPLTVLSIFLFAGIRSINSSNHHDHSTESNKVFEHRFSTPNGRSHSRASSRVTTTDGNTAVSYGRAKTG
ncbi:hypothetical protein GOBAR_AA17371 [Gossypium barbadense]|uniref:Uncharacterized protein n=1 Tax=Gossypium barbadense TaxID=3634 RepID=A0A2P5XIW1_GOSBA|nr:hypothetical protein GOBAR_AA17371 [Gossypium barbadense]